MESWVGESALDSILTLMGFGFRNLAYYNYICCVFNLKIYIMRVFLAILLLSVSLLTSCGDKVWGDDIMTTLEYGVLTDIDAIEVQSSVNLKLSSDIEPGTLTITANNNIHKYITVSYPGDKILIEMESHNYRGVDVTVLASVEQYGEVIASGVSTVTKDVGIGDFTDYSIALSGSASFYGDVTVKNRLSLNLSGSSVVSIEGAADDCEIIASGTSSVKGYDFVCDDLDVDLSGSSSVKMSVLETIEGEMSGSSNIDYKGDSVHIAVALKGTSAVNCVN